MSLEEKIAIAKEAKAKILEDLRGLADHYLYMGGISDDPHDGEVMLLAAETLNEILDNVEFEIEAEPEPEPEPEPPKAA